MRVYRDLELVEQLGSGVLRIFTPPQVERLLAVFTKEHKRQELQHLLGLSDRKNFTKNYLNPAIEAGFVALSNPNSPTSSEQRYTLTALGKRIINQ